MDENKTETRQALAAELERLKQEKALAVRAMEQARAKERRRALVEMSERRERHAELEQARTEAEQALREQEALVKGDRFGGQTPEEAAEAIEDVRRRARGLEKLSRRVIPPRTAGLLLLIAAVAFLWAGLTDWAAAPLAVGLIALVLFATVFGRLLAMKKAAAECLEDRKQLLAAWGAEEEAALALRLAEYEERYESLSVSRERLRRAELALELEQERDKRFEGSVLRNLDFSAGDSEAVRAGQRVTELEEQLRACREKLAAMDNASSAPIISQ